MNELVRKDGIAGKIHLIRGVQVMLDRDLAELYETETRTLKQAVKRNIERFPANFMFELEDVDINRLVSQSVIPSKKQFGGAVPLVFSEQGVAMLSSVLRTPLAVEMSIKIIRTFVEVRRFMLSNAEIFQQLQLDLEKHNAQYPPVEIVSFESAHDRFLILDGTEVYHIGASLKDLGKKWFAFSKIEKDAFRLIEQIENRGNR